MFFSWINKHMSLLYYCAHCPKINLNLRIKTKPVMVYVWIMCQIIVQKSPDKYTITQYTVLVQLHSHQPLEAQYQISFGPLNTFFKTAFAELILDLTHRRRINTEEKAMVVAAVYGTEFLKFLDALAVLH